jgi:hypothetical protein
VCGELCERKVFAPKLFSEWKVFLSPNIKYSASAIFLELPQCVDITGSEFRGDDQGIDETR